jgi:replicative DNA helicase
MESGPGKPILAEMAMLSCALTDEQFLDAQRAAGRKPELFCQETTSEAWELMCEMRQRGLHVNAISLGQFALELGRYKVDSAFLAELVTVDGSVNHADTFVRQVMAGWQLRTMQQTVAKLQALALKSTSFDEDRKEIEQQLTTLSNLSLEERGTTLKQDVQRAIADISSELSGERVYSNELYTGLKHFDRTFGPIDAVQYEDYMVVIAAGPSVGKSSLSRSIAWENITRGRKGCIFLLETTRPKFVKPVASQVGKVNLRQLKEYADLHKDNMQNFAQVLSDLETQYSDESLFVFDDHYTIEEIESRARHVAAVTGHLDFIVIDYLQLVSSSKQHGSREQEVAEISRRCKVLGKDLKCTVFCVAQLNREGRKLARPPCKEDLRESGSIEQDADRILLLHRPERYEGRDREGNKVEKSQDYQNDRTLKFHVDIIQDKCRNGPTGRSSVLFWRNYTLFEDYPNVTADGLLRKQKEYRDKNDN